MNVIDSSIFIKWFIFEDGHEDALRLFETDLAFVAPSLIACEVANVAWKKLRRGEIDSEDGDLMVRRCTDGLLTLVSQEKLAFRAWRIARDLDHPVYDCFYLACAEVADCPVMTADARLYRRVQGTRYTDLVRFLTAL